MPLMSSGSSSGVTAVTVGLLMVTAAVIAFAALPDSDSDHWSQRPGVAHTVSPDADVTAMSDLNDPSATDPDAPAVATTPPATTGSSSTRSKKPPTPRPSTVTATASKPAVPGTRGDLAITYLGRCLLSRSTNGDYLFTPNLTVTWTKGLAFIPNNLRLRFANSSQTIRLVGAGNNGPQFRIPNGDGYLGRTIGVMIEVDISGEVPELSETNNHILMAVPFPAPPAPTKAVEPKCYVAGG